MKAAPTADVQLKPPIGSASVALDKRIWRSRSDRILRVLHGQRVEKVVRDLPVALTSTKSGGICKRLGRGAGGEKMVWILKAEPNPKSLLPL